MSAKIKRYTEQERTTMLADMDKHGLR